MTNSNRLPLRATQFASAPQQTTFSWATNTIRQVVTQSLNSVQEWFSSWTTQPNTEERPQSSYPELIRNSTSKQRKMEAQYRYIDLSRTPSYNPHHIIDINEEVS